MKTEDTSPNIIATMPDNLPSSQTPRLDNMKPVTSQLWPYKETTTKTTKKTDQGLEDRTNRWEYRQHLQDWKHSTNAMKTWQWKDSNEEQMKTENTLNDKEQNYRKHKTSTVATSYVVLPDKPVVIIHAGRNQASE